MKEDRRCSLYHEYYVAIETRVPLDVWGNANHIFFSTEIVYHTRRKISSEFRNIIHNHCWGVRIITYHDWHRWAVLDTNFPRIGRNWLVVALTETAPP